MPNEVKSDEVAADGVGSVPTVLVFCPDLFFASRIQTIARHAGVNTAAVLPGRSLPQGDLLVASFAGGAGWEQAIRDAVSSGIPAIAFGPHVDVDGRRKARQAGAVRVLANGNVDRALAPLFQEMAATGKTSSAALSDLPQIPEEEGDDHGH
jgi:hypothetical protein